MANSVLSSKALEQASLAYCLKCIRTNGVLVLYLNLRPSIDIFSFLPRDVIPAEILTEARWAAADYSAQCCAFFAAVFTMVTEFLSTRLSSGSLEGALKQWNDSMCELRSEGRKQFFAGLNTKCDMYLEVAKCATAAAQADDGPSNSSLSGYQLEQADKSMPALQYMIGAYSHMIDSLHDFFGGGERHRPKFVIALDEAHTLDLTISGDHRLSSILRKAIGLYSGGAARVEVHLVRNGMASTWSQRFCLDVTLGTLKVTEFAKSTVSSHLRICISTTQNRNWVFTTYPSEPFLSCAGAFLLHGNLERSLIALQDIIFSELVKVGESGKLARRLLWLLAKDLCVRRTPYRAPIFCLRGEFLEKAGKKARKAFKNAFVNFTHWVSMGENTSPKNGDQLATQALPLPSNSEFGNFARHYISINCHSSLPWIAILVDMGLKESKLEANFTVPVNQPEHLNTRDMSDGPCLRIYAAAISNVTFPFLSQSEQLQRTLARIIDNVFPGADAVWKLFDHTSYALGGCGRGAWGW
ncbi:hypothetical protein EDD16DRAFT_1526124 [Pisolithus croceorrhizus]|nr:hypothetical protein EDD16DRAFT_1526124 [Pisolithus croceorrhizus]KAI6161791.1 hypothetical protein EDD17DRAFT_1508668 [Pisolithus thermaeus]